jgi:hypothetical protein
MCLLQRFFNGSIAHLLIFDSALSPEDVAALFAGRGGNATLGPSAPAVEAPPVRPAERCTTPCFEEDGLQWCSTATGDLSVCFLESPAPQRSTGCQEKLRLGLGKAVWGASGYSQAAGQGSNLHSWAQPRSGGSAIRG